MSGQLLLVVALMTGQTPEMPTVQPSELQESRVKTLTKETASGMLTGLTIQAELKGPAIKQASKYGNFKVAEARDDTGADLILKEGFFGSNRPEMQNVDSFSRKEDRLKFDVRLKTPARAAKRISVKGTVDVAVGGTRVNADIAKIKSLAGTELKHAELTAAGLKFKIQKADKALEYTLEANEALIDEVILLDNAGKKIETSRSSYSMGKGPRTYSMQPQGSVPADATLRIVVLKGSKTLTVPFAFKDLDLP